MTTTSMVHTNGKGDTLATSGSEVYDLLAPNVDIFESDREILIDADFPGITPDALEVQLDGGELTLEGRRPAPPNGRPSRLRRTFRVPESVDPGGVEAELRNGVLRVRLPKREEALPRRIEIRAAD